MSGLLHIERTLESDEETSRYEVESAYDDRTQLRIWDLTGDDALVFLTPLQVDQLVDDLRVARRYAPASARRVDDPTTASIEAITAERDQYLLGYQTMSARAAELACQVESMAMRIDSLAEELAKPEDVRLRDVVDALDGRAVIFDGLGQRVRHILREMDEWIARAGRLEREVAARQEALERAVADKHDLIERMTGAEAALHRFNGVG